MAIVVRRHAVNVTALKVAMSADVQRENRKRIREGNGSERLSRCFVVEAEFPAMMVWRSDAGGIARMSALARRSPYYRTRDIEALFASLDAELNAANADALLRMEED